MNKAFNFSYLLNMVIQGFWCLLFPIGIAFGIGWLLINKLSCPSWSMIPLVIIATFIGLFSMCRFLVSAADAMERMDKQRQKDREEARRAYKERQKLEADLGISSRKDSLESNSSNEANGGREI